MKPIPYTVHGRPQDLGFVAVEMVEIHSENIPTIRLPLTRWCVDTLKCQWSHQIFPSSSAIRFHFEDACDAVAFKLRWASLWEAAAKE